MSSAGVTGGAGERATSDILDRKIDLPVLDLHFVGLDRADGGEAERAPALDVEAGAVPRTLDLTVFQDAVREREVLVAAVVPHRVDLPVSVGQADLLAVDLDPEELPRRNVLQGSDPYVFHD